MFSKLEESAYVSTASASSDSISSALLYAAATRKVSVCGATSAGVGEQEEKRAKERTENVSAGRIGRRVLISYA